MSNLSEQDGGHGYPPFLIPRPGIMGHVGAMSPGGMMAPGMMGPVPGMMGPAPTRVNFYNPIIYFCLSIYIYNSFYHLNFTFFAFQLPFFI